MIATDEMDRKAHETAAADASGSPRDSAAASRRSGLFGWRPSWWTDAWARRVRLTAPLVLGVSIGAGGAAFPPTRDAALDVVDNLRRAALSQPEFRLRKIELIGARHLTDQDVVAALDLTDERLGALGFDARDARRRLEALGWVSRASVRLRPPHDLVIEVQERLPALLWRRAGGLVLLDRAGVEIARPARRSDAPNLPLIVGAGVEAVIGEALDLHKQAAQARLPVVALTRIGERRWDLELLSGPRVMLPEQNPSVALARFIVWVGQSSILDRGFAQIDLRLNHAPMARLDANR